MCKQLKKLYKEYIWRRFIVPRTYEITDKGTYVIQYLLDKYINETKPDDYIEAYEKSLQEKVDFWRNQGGITVWFYNKKITTDDNKDLMLMAAINQLTIMLSCIKRPDRTKYYEQIKDENVKIAIFKIVEGK